MNTNINQIQTKAANCCSGSCQITFQVNGQEIVNTFRCNQRSFSVSDMWKIQRNKKEVSITAVLL